MDSPTAPRLEAKLLYRRLDSLFGALDSELPPRRLIESFLEDAFQTLRADLRLKAGILYGEGRDSFSLLKTVGRLERQPAHVFDEDMLGLSIGDASGHGLPAALLVRDVVTGLRMGLERELKIAHVFTKLNRVIHRSTLSSRFVSVFYAELEKNGNLIYVNAGHQPPLLFDTGKDRVIELSTGGTVIGPLPEVRFHRGMAYLRPGDLLVMCTDGILERRAPDGTFFGEERLRDVVRQNRGAGASALLEAIFAAAEAFGASRAWEDDATVLVVLRQA